MPEIILTSGQVAQVDVVDLSYLYQWSWTPLKSGQKTYAARGERDSSGYKKILLHHEVAKRARTFMIGFEIDHINGDSLDNRRENLRPADKFLQNQNAALRSDSTSGVRGVSLDRRSMRWKARIQLFNTRVDLGLFDTLEEAEQARLKAEVYYRKA